MKVLKKIKFILFLLFLFSFKSEDSLILKWNFNNFNKLTYDYTQTVLNNSSVFGKQKVVSSGIIEIITNKSKDKASITLKMAQIKTFDIDNNGKETDSSDFREYPDFVIGNLTNDGNYEEAENPQTKHLMRVLFPIANKELKLLEAYDLPLRFQYNYFTNKIVVNGFNRIIYWGNETLKTEINVSQNTDTKLKKEFEAFLIGNSNYRFDKQKNYYKEADIYFNMNLSKKQDKFFMNSENNINMKLKSVE